MSSALGFTQWISRIVKSNWLLIIAAVLLICCTCAHSKSIDVDHLPERQLLDGIYPTYFYADESDLVERAAPRLGRASPRLGRASPRLGRRALVTRSRLNHAGRYYNGDDDAADDMQYDAEANMQERRAAPRLGRAV